MVGYVGNPAGWLSRLPATCAGKRATPDSSNVAGHFARLELFCASDEQPRCGGCDRVHIFLSPSFVHSLHCRRHGLVNRIHRLFVVPLWSRAAELFSCQPSGLSFVLDCAGGQPHQPFSRSPGLCAVIIFLVYLVVRYANELPFQRLAILCLAIIVAHLIVVSGFSQWWAGHCFGPRFTTGLVPWFALLGILAIRARLAWHEKHEIKRRSVRWNAEIAFGATLLLISVGINARGAMNGATAVWNQKPVNVDEHPERIWDWKHPQFLATRRD